MKNQEKLNAAFEYLTSALELLNPSGWDQFPAAGPDMTKPIEDAISLLVHDIECGAEVMKGALKSRSAAVLDMVLKAGDKQFYIDVAKRNGPDKPLKEGNIAQLEVLVAAGIPLGFSAEKLMREAWNLQSPAYFDFIRNTLGETVTFIEAMTFGDIVFKCPDAFVDEVVREIEACEKEGTLPKTWDAYARNDYKNIPIKAYAVLIMSGFPLHETLKDELPIPGTDAIVDLIGDGPSSHRRLAIKKMEPCLRDVLTRRENGTFFGLTERQARNILMDW